MQAEKLSSVGELVSGVAHEINNPLTSIMGFSQLLQREPELSEEGKESLDLVYSEANRIKKIVQNLLGFARRHAPEKKPCQVNEIIEQVLDVRAYEMKSSDVEIVREMDPQLAKTMLDPNQMRQVFLNIINNALQAMRDKAGTKRLTITSAIIDDKLVVSFEDTGPGIPREQLSRIFDPFFTTKAVGEGTGLGLSVSHGIIREHDGQIRVESKVGAGTQVLIELPAEQAQGKDEEARPRTETPDLPLNRVLVIDDEQPILDVLKMFLTREGCQADTAPDGSHAIEYLKEHRYDLVISDLRMPKFDGWKLYEWVVKYKPELREKIVFMTGDVLNNKAQAFFRESNALYLSKPFTTEELAALLARCLKTQNAG